MFTLRGIAVSLTFFVLLYCSLSALAAAAWRWLRWLNASGQNVANALFLMRVLPLSGSVILTFAFVVPSFQLLEPRSTAEGVGVMPTVLGIAAISLIAWGCHRVIAAQCRTSRVVAVWLEHSRPFRADIETLALRSRRGVPPLTLVGMRKPQVLVSDSTVALLSEDELRIALKHELAHTRSYDNLKKLVFRLCPFPGMAKLEVAWSQAAELAADDAAVSNKKEAIDLAAALVKLSRLLPAEAVPACTVGFVGGPLSARIVRLLAWDESRKTQSLRIPRWAALPSVAAVLFCAFSVYGPALAVTHEVTEWLVR